jgi:hypothetical protein
MDSGVYRLGEPQLQEGCSGVECAAADVLSSQFVSLTLVTVTLLALVALTYFHRAREECGEEQSRLQAERSALERFESQIRGLSAASVGQSTPSRGGATLAQSNVETRSQLQAVQNAYRDTVMAVPHYQEDYGESLTEHMTAEFGEDVTTAVVEGSTLTPQVKRALVSKASESRKERAAFARTLAAESESVTTVGEELSAIDSRVERIESNRRLQQSFRELAEQWEELDDLEADCEAALTRRQETVQRGATSPNWREGGYDLCAYLYESLPVTYPVLADGALLTDRIETTKRKVTEALTRRV